MENVGVPLVYRGERESNIREKSIEYLEKVGMGDRINHRPNELSGGQQQRIAIARALVGEPSFIWVSPVESETGLTRTQNV